MVKNAYLFLVTFSLFILQQVALAQDATVIFKGENEFQITINQIKQHQNFGKAFQIINIKGNNPYQVTIHFKNDTLFYTNNIYLIDDELTHIYEVTKKSIQPKKIVPTINYTKQKDLTEIAYISNKNVVLEIPSIDSAIIDTAIAIPFSTYYKLEGYQGRIACPFPIKDADLSKLNLLASAEDIEEFKLEKLKNNIELMDSACLLIEQINTLIVLFEFEETRLDFAKFIFPYTFDIDNYEKLYANFNYENSKATLKTLYTK